MLQLNENKQFAFFQRLAFPLRIFLLILVFSIFVIAAPRNILRPVLRTI